MIYPNQPNLTQDDGNRVVIPNFDTMTTSQFEEYLPEYFAAGGSNVGANPRFQAFLDRNPDCAALVRDLEAIARAAMDIMPVHDPADSVWNKIKEGIGDLSAGIHPIAE